MTLKELKGGPCPTCGQMFLSNRKGKIYCDMECYSKDPKTATRLRKLNEEKSKEATKKALKAEAAGEKTTSRPKGMPCKNCGEPCRIHRSYCSSGCRREYFNARFDRWIASPQKLALPQNYDEFLLQDVLPCLVEGCQWKGKHLSFHMNVTHGVSADEFKELAGFNKKTGVVSYDVHKLMSRLAKERVAAGLVTGLTPGTPGMPRKNSPSRLEGREHSRKAHLDAMAQLSDRIKFCRQCGIAIRQPKQGQKLYCSPPCRNKYYYNVKTSTFAPCAFCGTKIQLNRTKEKTFKAGRPVCCSVLCRNRFNIAHCLAVRNH